MFKLLPLYSDTRPETSSPFVDCFIDNGLLQAGPDLDQALLQLIHIFHRLLVYMMLYTAPNAVIDRVEVEAVLLAGQRSGGMNAGVSRRRNSTVARAQTNGEDAYNLALCPSRGTAV